MVLKTEQQPGPGNVFQLFASGKAESLSGKSDAGASSSEEEDSFEIVQKNNGGQTGDRPVKHVARPAGGQGERTEQDHHLAQVEGLREEIERLKMQLHKQRVAQISLEIRAGQLETEKEEASIQLSRTKMSLAKEKASRGRLRERYQQMLDDSQLSGDKLVKKLAERTKEADALKTQLKTELEEQKIHWSEINQQLHKENEHCVKEIGDLKAELEETKAVRLEERSEGRAANEKIQRKLEDALQASSRLQMLYEKIQLENMQLRKEKTEMGMNYESKLNKLKSSRNQLKASQSPEALEEDLSTDGFLRMMQASLGMEGEY